MYLHALGHYFPSNVLDNHFFDKLDIGSSADWIEERVGIKSRRSVLKPEDILEIRYGRTTLAALKEQGRVESIASMAQKAWSNHQERFGGHPTTTDTVISGTSVPDDDIPASACVISEQLKIQNIQAFDVNSACSTFVVQCHVMRALMESKIAKEGLIFCTERYTTRMNYGDRKNSILFGDGAVCASISRTPKPHSLRIIDSVVESAPSDWRHIHLPDGGLFHQNGAAVQKFAITKTIEAAQNILKRNQLTVSDAQWFIGHQANYRMLLSAIEKMGVSQDRHLSNVIDYGNQGACGAPAVLSMNWSRYKPGDYIVMAVVGAGLTWGALLMQKTE